MSEKSVAVELGAALDAGALESELSAMELLGFAALGLMGACVAIALVRYYVPDFRPLGAIASALGLHER